MPPERCAIAAHFPWHRDVIGHIDPPYVIETASAH